MGFVPHPGRCSAPPRLAVQTPIDKGDALAKPNFQYQKRQRELEKKRKQEEKRLRKQERDQVAPPGDTAVPAPTDEKLPQS